MKKTGKQVRLAAKHSRGKVAVFKDYRLLSVRLPRSLLAHWSPERHKSFFIENVRNLIVSQGIDEMLALRTMMSMAIADALHFAPQEQVDEMVADAVTTANESIKICGCRYEPPPVDKRN